MNKRELLALPFFVRELKTARGSESYITIGWLVDNWNRINPRYKIDDPAGRRIIRHIRDTGLIKRLMADRTGYFVAVSEKAYQRYLDMLERRAKKCMKTFRVMRNQ